MTKTTLDQLLWPLMRGPSIKYESCPICGRNGRLEQHHIVKRSAGKLFDGAGRETKKPTITLCGFGNNLKDADGRYFCHGLAHASMLHFRFVETYESKTRCGVRLGGGHWEYLRIDEPMKYLDALDSDGWKRLGGCW